MQMTTTSQAEDRYDMIFSSNHRQVYADFKRRTDLASAEDGTAETFLVAWRKIDEIPDGASIPHPPATHPSTDSSARRSRSLVTSPARGLDRAQFRHIHWEGTSQPGSRQWAADRGSAGGGVV
jgi:hypothetical protein